jgi:hypothetical protein
MRESALMLIARTFVWGDGRPNDSDEILSRTVDHHVTHDGVLFVLRHWDIRYRPGERRVTKAVYDEVRPPGSV